MIKLLSITLLFFFFHSAFAQVKFIDKNSSHPISAINFFDTNGNLVGISNKDGFFEPLQNQKNNLKFPLSVSLQHISYKNKDFIIESLDQKKTIKLLPNENRIDEVLVNMPAEKVTILTGYFRSLETFNKKPKQFIDGMISFYIPSDNKNKITFKITENRLFIDTTILQDYKSKMGPFFQIPYVVRLKNNTLSTRIEKLKTSSAGVNKTLLLKNNKEVGYITKNGKGNMLFYRDLVLPDSIKKEKIFRLEAHTFQSVNIENFNSQNLSSTSPRNLTSVYQNIVASIKRKKEYGHIPYEVLNEFYVIEKEYITLEDYKKIQKKLTKNVYLVPSKTSTTSNYWKELEKYNIPQVNKNIASRLGAELTQVN